MKYKAQVSNFNITFGDDEKPMLTQFEKVIYPAFMAGITKNCDNGDKYLFMGIEVKKYGKDNYVLAGKIVKKTILEIKSDLNDDGILIEKDEKHSSAPYSCFVINLLNHRMLFVQNQKGSPRLINFQSTFKHILLEYIKRTNQNLREEEKIEEPIVNIYGLADDKSIEEKMKDVEKVNSVTLRFYPLNGDIDYSDAFNILVDRGREEMNCKTGSITYNSPKSIEGVKLFLKQVRSVCIAKLKVTKKDNSKANIGENEFSVKYDIITSQNDELDTDLVMQSMSEVEIANETNDKHDSIFHDNLAQIIPFVKRGE